MQINCELEVPSIPFSELGTHSMFWCGEHLYMKPRLLLDMDESEGLAVAMRTQEFVRFQPDTCVVKETSVLRIVRVEKGSG